MASTVVGGKIKKLLIANRGEISCRVIRTCRKLGILSVAIYSDDDAYAPFVGMADEAFYIGGSGAAASYLNIDKVLSAIRFTKADAVHPGYGFLSENSEFAQCVEEETDAVFVGPNFASIASMGDKISSKKIAAEAKVSAVPGHPDAVLDEVEAVEVARSIGFPVIIKASAGGGGKGIRVVYREEDLAMMFSSVVNEGIKSFGNGTVFIEKYIENPRHIEIQVVADKYGNIVCLGERECSIQRNNQKIIEEAPSAFVTTSMRQNMYAQCISLAKKVGYCSAGTVEFIVDRNRNFYFLEMNTRLQVEHPVTEFVTGMDIVEIMIRVAQGEKLWFTQRDVVITGHAIESRICSEDPSRNFLPSIGRILTYIEPNSDDFEGSIRVDSGVRAGLSVTPFYDSMLAKMISYAPTRELAIKRSIQALNQYAIEGVETNILFLQNIQRHQSFVSGDTTTDFIGKYFGDEFDDEGCEIDQETLRIFALASVALYTKSNRKIWSVFANYVPDMMKKGRGKKHGIKTVSKTYTIFVSGIERNVELRAVDGSHFSVFFDGDSVHFYCSYRIGDRIMKLSLEGGNEDVYLQVVENSFSSFCLAYNGIRRVIAFRNARTASLNKICQNNKLVVGELNVLESPITGLITTVYVDSGDIVREGMPVLVIEAMKMENVVTASFDARVGGINFKVGDSVSRGDELVSFLPVESLPV